MILNRDSVQLLGEQMATQNVNIGVNVSDNGTTKKVVKNFKEIAQAAKKAQQAAQGINASGGTVGSRAVAAKAAPVGSEGLMSNQGYGSARGSAGLTGASARDFANQAQGLGGLVRLYATYAANVFAVSAAFTALSNAMDTANMVRGLDQLGAASGTALGSLSKDLVKATGGAISLRDAMTATAKASSSGMDSSQILRMGVVAQQASQALGVDMSDAISRISRGITKLEPELLDELGLFTKTGKAAEEYAKSVGKTVTELTDFERRAAFANAVLAEGEAKFSNIKLDVNPYTKLLASIKDLAQVSLEFINKGLAPIVGYLSNSPTALGVAIAALGAVLIKQALPALGEFKAGLALAADTANKLSIQKAQDAGKARLAIDANILSKVEAMADDKVAAVDAAEQKIQALEASGLNKRSAAYKLLQKDIADVTKADIDGVEARAKAAESGGDTKRAAAYREVTAAVLEHKKSEEDLIVTKQALSKQLEKDAQGMTVYGMTVRAAEKAQSAATKANIISNAAYNGSLIGVTASMTLMRAEMLAAGIATNTFAGRLLLARGALAAFGAAASTVMAALSPILLIITALSFAYSLLDGALSSNNKETGSLSDSLGKLDTNAKHLGETIDSINKKPFLERMSPESLKVKATALSEVSTAISNTVDDLLKADKAASGWDKFIDGFKTIWNGDILSKASKGLAEGITESLSKIAGSPEARALSKQLSDILKIDPQTASFEEVQDAIEKIGRESPQKLKLVQDSFKKISTEAQVTAAKGTELVDSFKKLIDIKKTIGNSFLPTDDFTKFGQELIATSQRLNIALDDPQQKLNAIIQLSANAVNIPGATFEQVTQLNKVADIAKEIQLTEVRQLENKQRLISKQEELSKLVGKDRAAALAEGKQIQIPAQTREGIEQIDKLLADLKELKSMDEVNVKVKTELTSKLESYSKEIEAANLNTFKAGADIVAKQISAEFIKAGKVVTDAYTNIIGETEATIKIKAQSEKAVIGAQIEQIKSQRDLTIATRELSLLMEQRLLQDQVNLSKSDPEATGYANPAIAKLAEVEKNLKIIEAAKAGDFSKLNLSSNVKDLKDLNVEGINFANNMRSSAAAIANLGAQIKAINIVAEDATVRVKFEKTKKNLEDQQKALSISKENLDVQGKLISQGNIIFLSAKQSLETKQLQVQQEALLLSKQVEQVRLDETASKLEEGALRDAALQKSIVIGQELKTLKIQQNQQKVTLTSAQIQEQVSASAFNAEQIRKREAENYELILVRKGEELTQQQKLFELYNSIGLLTETQKVKQKFLLEQKSAELDYEQKIAKAKSSSTQQLGALDTRETAIYAEINATETITSALLEELNRIADQRNLLISRTNEEADAAARVRDNTIGIASAIKAAALEQEQYNQRFNELLENSQRLGESLTGVFGDLGTKVGLLVESLVNVGIQNEKNNILLAKNVAEQKKLTDIDDPLGLTAENQEKLNDLKDQEILLNKKKINDELAGNIKTVSSAKNVFKEKTGAFKALDKIEKGLHLQRIALDLKEFALKMGLINKEQVASFAAGTKDLAMKANNALVSIGIDIPAIYAKTIGQLGVFGPPVAAAMIATFVGSAFGGKGGGSKFTPTAEQRQETQGTAMGYNSEGAKVQVRRGVFGDTDAKSESIANSLAIIKDNSVDGLSYDNKMLDLLSSIDRGINNTAKGLYSIQGLRNGSMFGTVEGTQSGGGLFGTGFFGSKTSRNITDSGLIIEGTFAQLASDTNKSVIDFFEQVTVSKKNWYGKTKTWVETTRTEIDNATSKFFQEIFGNATKVLVEVGSKANIGADTINEILSTMQLGANFTSLRGLKGEAFQKELSAVIGSVLDDAALAIFTSFTDFAEFGEGMLETVIRVVDTNIKVNQQIKNLGLDYANLDFGITENLVEIAGGLQEFLSQSNFFRENFLTEAERLAPIQLAVTEALATVTSSSVTTRDEFKLLVQSLDLTQESGQKSYQTLMNVAEGFVKITEEANKQADERKKLEEELFKLTATREQLREKELENLFAGNRELQKEIWLKEDQIAAAKALQSSLKGVTDTLKAQILSLQEYKIALLSGANSTLTAAQQYRNSRSEVEQLVATITKTAITPEEIDARNKALGKFSSASDKFLSKSRELFASGEKYSTDFNTVMSIIDTVGSTLGVQLTDAEKQLGALETANSYLESISNASKSTTQLLQTYLGLGGTPISTASLAIGTNYVPQDMLAQIHKGERIIPAADNAELMANMGNRNRTNEVLITEIKKLNEKISSLERTVAEGAVINADATNRNTEQIAQAVVDSSGKTIQATRLQAKASIK